MIHKDLYDYSLVNYVGCYDKVEIICKKHGVFKQAPHSHKMGIGCPKCRSSKGEASVRNWLEVNKIKYEEQQTFEGCKHKRRLKFDFYVPQHNLCIEYDGKQHFKIIVGGWGGGKEAYELRKLRDKIKNDYCKENKINLLRISYLCNIEERLEEYFNNINN